MSIEKAAKMQNDAGRNAFQSSKQSRVKSARAADLKDCRPYTDLICRRANCKVRRRQTAYISDRKCHQPPLSAVLSQSSSYQR